MELNTISRIEQYIVDALIASPLIPISVNVLRLADAIENEGVVQQTNNIVVRYTGSSDTVKNRIPMVFERNMSFELNFSCQNYLTSSGHDFATQLLAGAFNTINGGVPSGASVAVIQPFTCQSEVFSGISPESQYTYTQTFALVVEETLPFVALDPCVQRGDCRQLFPGQGVETKLPLAGVLDAASGEIYVPAYSGDKLPTEDYNLCVGVQWSNPATQSGDWVFIADTETIFIEDPLNQPIYLLSNNNYTEDGRLVVTVWDAVTREPIREVFYCPTGKKLARYAVELWNDAVERNGSVSARATKDSEWFSGLNQGEFAVVLGAGTFLFSDPLNPTGKQLYLDGGALIGIIMETFVQTPQGRFYFVQRSPQGQGWIKDGSFQLASINSLWKLGCVPCAGNSGPVPPF